ncbi:PREDICTED: ABC transporter A family member 2 [Populus euphratica]|uniref:ABC transporter A family member 2 n=1 Tax=Populus euphratica TaxID=75702 RepID=A0AAJ6VGS6_POPEU|nr:PREDICTED: ABC transporter A family member 2 [Populus euphratica]
MELIHGFPLLYQQFTALFKKNLLLSWRNKSATFLQLFSSFFFMFLLFGIQKASDSRSKATTGYKTVTNPQPMWESPIPPCEEKFYVKMPCFDFVWSGNDSSRIGNIVTAIMNNNPNRRIPSGKVKSFKTPEEVDDWLFRNPMQVPGALHFVDVSPSLITYGLQTNSTAIARRGHYEDPTFKFQIPLQIAAEREIARSIIGVPTFTWNVGLTEFAHPAKPTFSAVATVGPAFFLAFTMFGFVLQISNLVAEKELKLRQAMNMTGLYESAYWTSWLIWEGIITFISSLLLVLFGLMFQFDFFKKNSFGVLFFVFFLFQVNMIGFAFMLSTLISKASSGTTMGFSIFIVGFMTQIVTIAGFPYKKSISSFLRFIWSFFPPNLLAKAVNVLSDASSTPEALGISWKGRSKCPPDDDDCVMTINDVYTWLICLFILWFALAIYFDNIFPNVSGVRKSVFYFFKPGYWTGKGGDKVEEGGLCSCITDIPQQEHIVPDDEDVLEEENIVKNDARDGTVNPDIAVQIRGLGKTYPGATHIGCFKCKKTSPYHAVRDLWVNFTKDQLFCLLGPNGAGKTTTINCLTGITPVTGGDALVYGHSVRSTVGMSGIRKIIGVCPQFDILWDALSGEEHLELFASIKGLPPASIKSVARESLAQVKLTESAKVRARSYSGGMRRRLSVAISLLGDPKLVILDEPTTGMDPISRRHVWDIIQNTKKGRAIVLTTHSMEEADILSDRIGIMAKGRLRCIGNSIRLKSKFGTGFIANVRFGDTNGGHTPARSPGDTSSVHHEAVKKFFKSHLDVTPTEETRSFSTFVIPHDKESVLKNFFAELQARQREFNVSDIQLGLATLEEVFLNIAKQAELESAAAEGKMVTLDLTSGKSVQIPVGARFVGVPETNSPENPGGTMVEVYWEQDDSGSLCISRHSAEMPVPRNVQPLPSEPQLLPRTNILGGQRRGPAYGMVYDSDQIIAAQSR